MVLAGLVAGTVTASTAFRISDPPPADAATLAAAAAPAPVAATPAPAEAVAPVVGNLRAQEAAIAEWEYRLNLPPEPSRSTNTPGSLVRPAQGGRTGWYGEPRGSRRHAGIDFDGDTGDAIVAAGAGTVTHADWAPSGYSGYGRMVLIDHGNGVTTLYAHLSRIAVGAGTEVHPGQYIGAMGTTGNVTGSHLHFEVRLGGRAVNPGPWIAG
jgi:murein DD-endopeptidase MepM/ murein hydrolase activator NlpD